MKEEKKNDMQKTETLINKKYYIIKVICDTTKKTYYKIGEGNTVKRPEDLIEKDNKLRKNFAELLFIEDLPSTKDKRLNDKLIHKHLDPKLFKPVSAYEIQVELDETDGKDEFFELVDPAIDIIAEVKKVVASIKPKEYTAKVIRNIDLVYGEDQYHLVDYKILDTILTKFDTANKRLYENINNNILLIGQFDSEFVATIALQNNVTIWHDTADNKHIYLSNRINDKINYIENLEELIDMEIKFDLIIANPPYGAIGANITKNIIDNVDFDEYINLLPANDYKRNNSKDLFKYQTDMVNINNGFADAVVTTHLARINKKPNDNLTLDEFEIENYIDDSLKKYFYENRKREHYAIDASTQALIFDSGLSNRTTLLIDHRYIPHKHLAFSKETYEYKWNVLKSITLADLSSLFAGKVTFRNGTALNKYVITFKSEQEMTNITNFIYSSFGFRFMSKLAAAINVDSTVDINKVLPKVDWTRSWTVEEILEDYGYTETEIKEVMDDLVNFKGMED